MEPDCAQQESRISIAGTISSSHRVRASRPPEGEIIGFECATGVTSCTYQPKRNCEKPKPVRIAPNRLPSQQISATCDGNASCEKILRPMFRRQASIPSTIRHLLRHLACYQRVTTLDVAGCVAKKSQVFSARLTCRLFGPGAQEAICVRAVSIRPGQVAIRRAARSLRSRGWGPGIRAHGASSLLTTAPPGFCSDFATCGPDINHHNILVAGLGRRCLLSRQTLEGIGDRAA